MPLKHIIIPVTPFQQNCSLLICQQSQSTVVIDPGGEPDLIINELKKQQAKVERVLLTHGHLDHVSAAMQIANFYNVDIEGPHKNDDYWLDDLQNFAAMMQFPPCESFHPDKWLQQGDVVKFGSHSLDVLHCPGHTPGHLVFYSLSEKLVFVGDVLFHGSIGRTDFPGGDHETLINSIKTRLFPLGDEVRFVPGHGPMSTLGHERLTNPYLR